MIGQLFAGAGLGLLVGFLVGLSSSPVVAVVVGALSAAIVTLLGFVRPAKEGEPASSDGSVVRLGSFGLVCTLAILAGLYIRTHNFLSPTITQQVAEVKSAGYSDDDAHKWVWSKNLSTGAGTGAEGDKARPVAGSYLFSAVNTGECQHFDGSRYKDTKEHLNALQQLGGKYAEYADKISRLDRGQQKMVLDSLRILTCPL
jgi:hypothetical protein